MVSSLTGGLLSLKVGGLFSNRWSFVSKGRVVSSLTGGLLSLKVGGVFSNRWSFVHAVS